MNDEFGKLNTFLHKIALGDEFDNDFAPLFVGVCGGSASGKSTLCANIDKELGGQSCSIVSLDSYYKGIENPVDAKDYNFDHPNSLDFDLAYQCLLDLADRKPANIPIYNFKTHKREVQTQVLQPTDIVLFEGILALYDERIRNLMTFKIFVHCDDDIRLCRRIKRDVVERGRDVMGILYQYNRFVKRSYEEYVRPTMNYADIIVPGSRPNEVSIKFVVQNLKNQLVTIGRLKNYFRNNLVFQADMFEQLWVKPLNDKPNDKPNEKVESKSTIASASEDVSLNKQMIFETDEIEKNLLKNAFKLVTSTFKIKGYHQFMKNYIKHGLMLFEKQIIANKISFEEIDLLEMDETKEVDKKGEYALLIYAYLVGYNFEDVVVFLKKIIDCGYQGVYIVNVFANMRYLIKIADVSQKIKIVNMFCICNSTKFRNTLMENCLDAKDIFVEAEYRKKYSKKGRKFLEKKLAAEKKKNLVSLLE